MCDTTGANSKLNLREYAQQEYTSAPLTAMMHARFPASLAVFMRTAALTAGVSESTAIRFACRQWAESQGFNASCV
jgi:hypothetical protein